MDKKYMILATRTPTGEKIDKIICELEDDDVGSFKSMGKAIGTSLGHCLFLGLRHKENFWHRVMAYRIFEDRESRMFSEETGKEYTAVEFYEKPD